MASKQSLKLIDIKGRLRGLALKLEDFIRHTILLKKRELLIIGEKDHPVVEQLVKTMPKSWVVTVVGRNRATRNEETGYIQLQDNYM